MSLYLNHQRIDLSAPDRCAIRAHNRDASGQSDCGDLIESLSSDSFDALSIENKSEYAFLNSDWADRIVAAALAKNSIGLMLIVNDFEVWLKANLAQKIVDEVGS